MVAPAGDKNLLFKSTPHYGSFLFFICQGKSYTKMSQKLFLFLILKKKVEVSFTFCSKEEIICFVIIDLISRKMISFIIKQDFIA